MSASAPRFSETIQTVRHVRKDLKGEELVQDLIRYVEDLHKIIEESLTSVADKANFAGPQRYAEGRTYHYHEGAGLWVSVERMTLDFARAGAVAVGQTFLKIGDLTPGSGEGYRMPADFTLVRWTWEWTGGAASAGDELALLTTSSVARSKILAGGETSFSEDLLQDGSAVTIGAGQVLRARYTSAAGTQTNLVVTAEVGWTRTFDA